MACIDLKMYFSHLFHGPTINIDDHQSSHTYFTANLLELSGELIGHDLWDR